MLEKKRKKYSVSQKDYHELLRYLYSPPIQAYSLFEMHKVSETLVPGGKSVITSYLHIVPQDFEELIAQMLIRGYPALFSPTSRVLEGHTDLISSVASDTRW